MDEVERIITRLHATKIDVQNFKELSENYNKEIEVFERKVFSAPLIGCGAGLVLFATAFKSNEINPLIVSALLPSLWFFFFGVLFSVITGLFYIFNMSNWRDENIISNNVQNSFITFHKSFSGPRGSNEYRKIEDFNSSEKSELLKMASQLKEVKNHNKWGQRWVVGARIMIMLSSACFIIGVVIPLVIASVNSKFIGI